MGRVVGIDYGNKRVGIAVTDELRMIASPLTTVHSKDVLDFLKDYAQSEIIDEFVVGMPRDLKNQETNATSHVKGFVKKLRLLFPQKNVYLNDERFTSKIAIEAMVTGGMKKSQRQKKENIDKISATLILQSYLASKK